MKDKLQDVLFLIPARSGSKGVPNKNIQMLGELPLLAYRIFSAHMIADAEHIWLSTDSLSYIEKVKDFPVTVPFIRPDSLSNDGAKSMDVVLHAMQHATDLNKRYQFIALLEPTSPFVYWNDLKLAIEQLRHQDEAHAIVATKRVETATVYIQPQKTYLDLLAKQLSEMANVRRQDAPIEITPSGGFYIAKWDALLEDKNFYTEKTLSYLLPEECSLEIDSPLQMSFAQFMVEKQIIDLQKIYSTQYV